MNVDMSSSSSCSLHQKEPIVGICHLCLNERLLILAVEQSQSYHHHRWIQRVSNSPSQTQPELYYGPQSPKKNKNKIVKFPCKIFAFGSSVFCQSDPRRGHEHFYSDDDSSASPDRDSFISIKFEENGVASWDKGNSVSKVYQKPTKFETFANQNEGKKVIKHPKKPRGRSMRWQKRVGHMFQLIRWKRSSSKRFGGGQSHVRTRKNGAKGWMIRTLTKRRTRQ